MYNENQIKEQYNSLFWDILDNEMQNINKDNEYEELCKRCEELLVKYPTVADVVDNKKNSSLNEEEVNVLVEYYQKIINRMIIEQKRLLLIGGRYAYYIFKNMGIIKDETI